MYNNGRFRDFPRNFPGKFTGCSWDFPGIFRGNPWGVPRISPGNPRKTPGTFPGKFRGNPWERPSFYMTSNSVTFGAAQVWGGGTDAIPAAYREVAKTAIIPTRIFATNRAAIGRIWTMLRRSKDGPRGRILVSFRAQGGPKHGTKEVGGLLPFHQRGLASLSVKLCRGSLFIVLSGSRDGASLLVARCIRILF